MAIRPFQQASLDDLYLYCKHRVSVRRLAARVANMTEAVFLGINEAAKTRSARIRALGSACLAHVVHDGYSDLLYLLFPIWQREFALSFAAVGAMKTMYSGALALFQIPAARMADRFGERAVLVAGTLLAAFGVMLYGTAGSVFPLFGFLLLAGLGAAVQHPLSSSIVARAFQAGSSRAALATYNFTGDIGKVLVPATAALLIWAFDWQTATLFLGAFGLALAFALLWLIPASRGRRPQETKAPASREAVSRVSGGRGERGFTILTMIGVIDNATRTGFLTFLPLLLSAKGAQATAIATALSLTFIGGAAGKFACGILAAKLGIMRTVIVTELATALLIGGLLVLPYAPSFLLMLPLGMALNGTSSVLYGSVAELAPPARRAHAFALFYTATLGAGALAPLLYGLIGDRIGITQTLLLVAAVVLLVLPLAARLAPYLAGGALAAQGDREPIS
jgi:MFS transporter, FSR family, fosmidomycin resistance protein